MPLVADSVRRTAAAAALATALAAALGGCVVEPARVAVVPPHVRYVSPVVTVAPPAPIVETYGVAPAPGAIWIDGYWNWVGGRHVWVGGRWQAPPRPGYVWVPHAWERQGEGWRLREGHWDRH